MAKRGRKPSPDKKGFYFQEIEEKAVVEYLNSNNSEEKNKIFIEILQPAFYRMVESIIRRYKLYPPQDESFEETFHDTLSFLMTKIDRFNAESGYKAYSYCGTVCKNYLIFKINQFIKNQKRQESYDCRFNEINEDNRYSYDQYSNTIQSLTELINETITEINEMIKNKDEHKLNENEIKVGKALVNLFENWEDLFAKMGSNKFNKSSILLFLKETTLLSTTELRSSMKKYKSVYKTLRKNILCDI
jgi:hypothetical protein